MKKMIYSLVTLMVLGTSTGFCKTNVKSNTNKQPMVEVSVSNGMKQSQGSNPDKTYNMQQQQSKQTVSNSSCSKSSVKQVSRQSQVKHTCTCKNCQKQSKQKKQSTKCTCKNCQKQNNKKQDCKMPVVKTQNHDKTRK